MPLSVKNAPVQCPVTVKSTLHKLHLSMFEYTNADVWRERPVQTNINTRVSRKTLFLDALASLAFKLSLSK